MLVVLTLATLMAPEAAGVAGALIIQWPTNGGTNQMRRPTITGL